MKKTLLIIISLVSFSKMNAQQVNSSLGFEKNETNNTIKITDLTGDWQIGKPQKNIFNAAKTGLGVVVTDTTKSYSADKLSQLTVLFRPIIGNNRIVIDFDQRVDINDNVDSTKVELSFDKGSNWFNMSQTQQFLRCQVGDLSYSGFNQQGTNSANTTSNTNWTNERLEIYLIMLLRVEDCPFKQQYFLDSLMMRFSFYSNTSQPTKDGWMIDNLRIQSDFVGGIEKLENQNEALSLAPNPSTNDVVKLQSMNSDLSVRGWILENMNGTILKNQSNSNEIETFDLEKGVYIVKIETTNGWFNKKLIIR
jgi:hypothetical protein